jgi:hypothetical protein
LLAGIAVARTIAAGRELEAALLHVTNGPADLAALDYDGATRVAKLHGWEIFSAEPDDSVAIRQTLSALMVVADPDWSREADRGRERALDGIDEDSKQCFRLGGLLESTDDAHEWWLAAARWRRSRRDERKRTAGLAAEKRSLEIERGRLAGTGLSVKWVAVEDSTAGHDIETWREVASAIDSVESTADGRHWRRHYLEVKSALTGNEIFLSRGEWDFAAGHGASWSLHVWWRGDALIEIGVAKIAPHVPADSGRGRWDAVRVPSAVLRS